MPDLSNPPVADNTMPPPIIVQRPEDTRPVDLWGQFEPPPLPPGLLPPVIEQFALTLAETMGADPAALAMSAVATCAAAIPDHVRLKPLRHSGWQESPRVWIALVGLPSTMKSPAMDAAVAPLAKIDGQLVREWRRQCEAWEALSKEEQRLTHKPLQQRVRLNDVTVEALQEVLRGTTTGVLVHRDELSGWFGAMEKYAGGGASAADRAVWLQSYNGGEYTLNRINRGTVFIDNLSASMLGGVQPDAIRRISANSVDDGLLQRFLPIVLRPAELAQDVQRPDVATLYGIAINMCRSRQPITLQFDHSAHMVREEVMQRHHRLQATEAFNKKLAAHIGKLNGIFARLCIVWHVVEHWTATPLPETISGPTARRVADFMAAFLLPHALSFYGGTLGLCDEDERLKALAGYILAHRKSEIDHRTVQQSVHDMRKLTVRDTRPIFETLAAMGWLSAVDDPTKRNGEPRWFVNPHVHTLFAARADQEYARRLQARSTIKELSGTVRR